MAKERIHLYLPSDVIQAIQTLAPHNGGISALAEELLQTGLSLKRGEVIEQQSLPIIREIIDSALNKAYSQIRLLFQEELHRQEQQPRSGNHHKGAACSHQIENQQKQPRNGS